MSQIDILNYLKENKNKYFTKQELFVHFSKRDNRLNKNTFFSQCYRLMQKDRYITNLKTINTNRYGHKYYKMGWFEI